MNKQYLNVRLNQPNEKLLTYQNIMCFNVIQLLRYSYKNNRLIIDSQLFQFSKEQKNERLAILNDFYIKYPKDFIDNKTPKQSLLKRNDFNIFYQNWFEKQIEILVGRNGYKKEEHTYKNNNYYLFKKHPSAIYIKENSQLQLDYLQYEDIHFLLDMHNNCYQCAKVDYRDSSDSYDDYEKKPNRNELSAKFCGGQEIQFK